MKKKWVAIGIAGVVITVVIGITSYIYASGSQPVKTDPDQQISQVGFSQQTGILVEPQPVDGIELDESTAISLYKHLAELSHISNSCDDSSLQVQKCFDPVQGCNVLRICGPDLFVALRAGDGRIINMQNLTKYDDPNLKIEPITEEEMRALADKLIHEFNQTEISDTTAYFSKTPIFPDYAISSILLNKSGPASYMVTFERVSATGIPYNGQGAAMMLRTDGVFINFVRNESAPSAESEQADSQALVSEQEAIGISHDIVQSAVDQARQWDETAPEGTPKRDLAMPTSALLAYVMPNWCFSEELADQVKGGGTPVSDRTNRLAWIIKVPNCVEVWVDAKTGSIIGGDLVM